MFFEDIERKIKQLNDEIEKFSESILKISSSIEKHYEQKKSCEENIIWRRGAIEAYQSTIPFIKNKLADSEKKTLEEKND